MTTQVLRFDRFGPASEVIALAEEKLPELGSHDVRVRISFAPINPSDLNYIEGKYGLKPSLPAVAGLEGAGEIIELGSEVRDLSIGQLVLPPREQGLWRRDLIVPATALEKVPAGLTAEQAAISRVNPPTAWCLLHEFAALQPGDWIVQNAANSAVGRAVIRLCRVLGLHSLNLVRRAELKQELQRDGADLVFTMEEFPAWLAANREPRARLGFNAVGGESALAVANALCPGGIHITYGAMARQPLKISNGLLIFSDLTFRGFWLTQWLVRAPQERVTLMKRALAQWWQAGVLQTDIEQTYPLIEHQAALLHANREGRRGKIMFRL
jgi:mitochondrial enoyl-[acyl-carrier protein] reductase / trans-2-enoyl-CoA reductase